MNVQLREHVVQQTGLVERLSLQEALEDDHFFKCDLELEDGKISEGMKARPARGWTRSAQGGGVKFAGARCWGNAEKNELGRCQLVSVHLE